MTCSGVIDCYGDLYMCGDNYCGQLGLGENRMIDDDPRRLGMTPSDYDHPFTRVPTGLPILQVSCGENHSAIIAADRRLYTCGDNKYGQLGLGNCHHVSTFTEVPIDLQFLQVVCTDSETIALGIDNCIYRCGTDPAVVHNNHELTLIPSYGRFSYISASNTHMVAIELDGSLYGCGDNGHGQLRLSSLTEYEIEYTADPFIPNLTRLSSNIGFRYVPSDIRFIHVACGNDYTMVISEDGDLYGCGDNEVGQLGLGDNDDRNSLTYIPTDFLVSQVACSYSYTMVISEDGDLYGCGDNEIGQLAMGDNDDRNLFVYIPTNHPISQVACSYDHILVLDSANNLYVSGYNFAGCFHHNMPEDINVLVLSDISVNGEISRLMDNLVLVRPQIKSALSGY